MRKFESIQEVATEEMFEDKLRRNGKEVITFEPEDHLVVTEKLDGANASVANLSKAGVQAFSHSGKKLGAQFSRNGHLKTESTLRGFLPFVQERESAFAKLPRNLTVYGEWLVSHHIKYQKDKYQQYYLFDVFDADKNRYLGIKETQKIYEKYFDDVDGIHMVPILSDDTRGTYADIKKVQEKYANKSKMSESGNMEGIVVVDLDKEIPIDVRSGAKSVEESAWGHLRIKFVNTQFKEKAKAKKTHKFTTNELSALDWISANITYPRIRKQIFEIQDVALIPEKVAMDWFFKPYATDSKDSIAKHITDVVFADALGEDFTIDPEIKKELTDSENVKRYHQAAGKVVNAFIAKTVKGYI